MNAQVTEVAPEPASDVTAAPLQVLLVSPDGYVHSAALAEVMETVIYGLRALGCEVTYQVNQLVLPGPRPIVFGAQLLEPAEAELLPPGTIIYNLEQIAADSTWCSPTYLKLLQRCQVWDYSARNRDELDHLGVSGAKLVPIGYVPELTRIKPNQTEDIDVLFYGSMNERREKVVQDLRAMGLEVAAVFGVYGAERDALISRSKVVLNMHYYGTRIFEIVRVSYLLSNARAVVAEAAPGTEIEPDIAGVVALAPYEELAATCYRLVDDGEARADLAQRGFEAMAARDERAYLAQALGWPPPGRAPARAGPARANDDRRRTPHLGARSDDEGAMRYAAPTPVGTAPDDLAAGRDEDLDARWQSAPSLDVLIEAAAVALDLPVPRQAEWSRRLRAAGLWAHCPLVATAQDQSLPVGRRAAAAGTAWAIDHDRQARAVLRRLLPRLSPQERATLGTLVPADALADLERGPFVWSVTPFFNELDILEARLTEMARAVDHFVIVEAPQTHRGDPKPLYYEENKVRFNRWASQIYNCVVELPAGPDAWERERRQRDVGQQVLTDVGAGPDDLILLTDLDEIVRADRVRAILEATATAPAMLMMTQYWYSLEWREPGPWLHPKAFRFGQVPPTVAYSDVRHCMYPVAQNAGWHFSWFGGTAQFDYKLSSFAHNEYDTPERRQDAYQQGLLSSGVDLHGRKLYRSGTYFPASLAPVFEPGKAPAGATA
jgi:hypothetical protein